MKWYKVLIIAIFSITLLWSCDDDPIVIQTGNKLLVLMVDYTTNDFEGGIEYILNYHVPSTDTLEFNVDYNPPADFGDISLTYIPTDDEIFRGTIIWNGSGEVEIPNYIYSSVSFTQLNTPITTPHEDDFQVLYYDLDDPINHEDIWKDLKKLAIVQRYLNENPKKIGLLLYTPSVGVGNPEEWKWFVFFNRNINEEVED